MTEVRLLDQLLAFSIGEDGVTPFEGWWRLYQAEVLPLLYPMLWDVERLTTMKGGKGEGIGFSSPPPLLHQSVISWMQSALPLYVDDLLPSYSALEKLLALLRLTFTLPPSSAASQLSVLSLYSHWLNGQGLSPLMRSHSQSLVMAMIDHLTVALLYREDVDVVSPSLAASFPSSYAEDEAGDGDLQVGRLSFAERQQVRKEVEVREGAHVQVSEKVFAFLSLPPLTGHSPSPPHNLPSSPLHAAIDHQRSVTLPLAPLPCPPLPPLLPLLLLPVLPLIPCPLSCGPDCRIE